MSNSREDNDVSASTEDRVNAVRGYKATLHNPRVSDQAKQHAQDVLDNELQGDKPRQDLYSARGDPNKVGFRVAAGLKAAQKNPRNSERGKQRAGEKLDEMSRQSEESS
ncbi:hypothetical protein MPDQ_005836 [Monascus purpureus]|uniref:Conidiation-specific protein 6 n=1 Tax=Monascus purpureus TaxID=5098 RepID=A0A507QZ88_MONPU|nr:hypothetical protein MPDQ_005836 [Monascus purpureus]BDD61009.1 hypothetical protein MAP00_006092 [Monascus purpureus]